MSSYTQWQTGVCASMQQKWPSHLVIVRHGESERNVAKNRAKLQGAHSYDSGLRDMDTPLTAAGFQQAHSTGAALSKELDLDVVFSSPYLRAVQTAECIRERMKRKAPLVHEERVREMEFGIFDGLTTNGIQHEYPKEFHRREREGKYWYRPPGGESRPDVALRVHSFLGTLARDYQKKNVLVVCHSVVVLVFRRLLERWGESEYMAIDAENDVLNCSITDYRYDAARRKLILGRYNYAGYKSTA